MPERQTGAFNEVKQVKILGQGVQRGTTTIEHDILTMRFRCGAAFWKIWNFWSLWSFSLRLIYANISQIRKRKKSFSKLKLLKSYLRNTVSQKKLCTTSLPNASNRFLQSINFDKNIDHLTNQKARIKMFLKKPSVSNVFFLISITYALMANFWW